MPPPILKNQDYTLYCLFSTYLASCVISFSQLDPDPDPYLSCGSMRTRIRNTARRWPYPSDTGNSILMATNFPLCAAQYSWPCTCWAAASSKTKPSWHGWGLDCFQAIWWYGCGALREPSCMLQVVWPMQNGCGSVKYVPDKKIFIISHWSFVTCIQKDPSGQPHWKGDTGQYVHICTVEEFWRTLY